MSIFKIGPFSHAPVKDVNIFPKFEDWWLPPPQKSLLDPAKTPRCLRLKKKENEGSFYIVSIFSTKKNHNPSNPRFFQKSTRWVTGHPLPFCPSSACSNFCSWPSLGVVVVMAPRYRWSQRTSLIGWTFGPFWKGKETSSNHHFPANMLVFRGVYKLYHCHIETFKKWFYMLYLSLST